MTERQIFRISWWAGLTGLTLAVLTTPVDMTAWTCFLLVWLWHTPYFNNPTVFGKDQKTKTIKSVFQRRQYQRRRRMYCDD